MSTFGAGPAVRVTTVVRIVLLSMAIAGMPAGNASGYSPEKAGFSVKSKDELSPYRVIGVFVLPRETLTLEVPGKDRTDEFVLQSAAGISTRTGPRSWRWQAPPEKGLYPVIIKHPATGDSVTLNVFVMVPMSACEGEFLNGYRIGRYPAIALKGLSIYEPPRGFVEVTEENMRTPVSPHFFLGQFLCKQDGGYPKYVVIRERLLLKLELVLEKTNEAGFPCGTFEIMSGYRTPYYNKLIGNVKYSRHVYGGAADIFIDENPPDDMMDDLNHDGASDYHDADILYDIIDGMYGAPWYERFPGGLGKYKKTPSHGPFVHVDVRGFRARWGD
jgi:hypothetical protein